MERTAARTFVLALMMLAGSIVTFSGCGRQDKPQQQAKVVLPSERQKTSIVRLMAPQTGEYARQLLPGKDNFVRTQLLIFRDGCRGELHLDHTARDGRPLRTWAREYHPDGSTTYLQFSDDGKTVVRKVVETRLAKPRFKSGVLPDGVKELIRFHEDGVTADMRERVGTDSLVERTLFYDDGKTPHAILKTDSSLTKVDFTLFGRDGKPVYCEQAGPYEETGMNEMIITVFSGGKPLFRQRWLQRIGDGEEGEQQPQLDWLEEFHADGKTVQRRVKPTFIGSENDGKEGFAIERFSPDGKLLERKSVTDAAAAGVSADRLAEVKSKESEALAPQLVQPIEAKEHDHNKSFLN